MNLRTIFAAVLGATLGAGGMFFSMRNSPSEVPPVDTPSQSQPEAIADDPFAATDPVYEPDESMDWSDWLSKLSGKWVSANGEQSAELDFRMLRFGDAADWPDLSGKTFLLGQEMQFLTDSGFYTISTLYSNPDEMRFIKEDSVTEDLSSLTLYREGSPRARSRAPIPEAEPPTKVQAILDGILTIKDGELKDAVLARLGLNGFEGLEVLAGESGLGETDILFDLGIDDHWMLYVAYTRKSPDAEESEAVLRQLQILRGYVDEAREGWLDTGKPVYPYFAQGQVITKNQQAEQDAAEQPATAGESK